MESVVKILIIGKIDESKFWSMQMRCQVVSLKLLTHMFLMTILFLDSRFHGLKPCFRKGQEVFDLFLVSWIYDRSFKEDICSWIAFLMRM